MNDICQELIYICPNCEEEYHFYEELLELQCEVCGAMVVKDD